MQKNTEPNLNIVQLIRKIFIYLLMIVPFLFSSNNIAAQNSDAIDARMKELNPQLGTKALILYDAEEIKNPEEWFGIWHFKNALDNLGVFYHQSSYQEYDRANDRSRYDLYICYFEDSRISDFERLYSILQAGQAEGGKVIIVGDPGVMSDGQGEPYSYQKYNRILNLTGLEDRQGWTSSVKDAVTSIDNDLFNRQISSRLAKEQITFFRHLFPFSSEYNAIVKVELNGRIYAPVCITPYGGVVLNPFLTVKAGNNWYVMIDFKKYFKEVLETKTLQRNVDDEFSRPVPRVITVLYSSEDYGSSERTNIFRRYFQLPFNRIGYDCDFVDIAGRKSLIEFRDRPFIFTAFQDIALSNYQVVLDLLVRSRAKKFIFAGAVPFFDKLGNSPYWSLALEFQKRFGVKIDGMHNMNANVNLTANPSYYPFEDEINPEDGRLYARLSEVSDAFTKVLILNETGIEYTPACYDNNSLFILGDIVFKSSNHKYFLDLFALTEKFMEPEIHPLYTMGYGRRLLLSHVDGDGFINTNVDHPDIVGAERIFELLKKIKLPVSISFIMSEILPEYSGRIFTRELAKRLLSLTNVEGASHTLNHPFYWNPENNPKNISANLSNRDEEDIHSTSEAGHYMLEDFSYQKEISGSIKIFNDEFDKKTNILFWSGDCEPTEEQLAFAREQNILTINGGDTLINGEERGYYYVSPPYTRKGSEVQIYAGAANENLYTNLWTGPFDGFRKSIRTFSMTGKPYMLAPVDIYYHFYSGSRPESFEALNTVYSWSLTQEMSPVFTSKYIKIVQDFMNMEIFLKAGGYFLKNNGNTMSVRIYKSKDVRDINLKKSINVIGFSEEKEYFDVFLDGQKEHFIGVADKKIDNHIYISALSHYGESMFSSENMRIFRFKGFGPFTVEFSGISEKKRIKAWFSSSQGSNEPATVNWIKNNTFAINHHINGELILKLDI